MFVSIDIGGHANVNSFEQIEDTYAAVKMSILR